MPKLDISSILRIDSKDLSYQIRERITSDEYFTTVTDAIPTKIPKSGLTILLLREYFGDGFEMYVCFFKKQQRVATSQVRLKGIKTISIPGISLSDIISQLPKRFQKAVVNSSNGIYTKLPQKTSEAVFDVLISTRPELKDQIDLLLEINALKSKFSTSGSEEILALEKDALATSLDIFGVERSKIIRKWDSKELSFGDSFLSGLGEYTLYEDDLISKDLHSVPGWTAISKNITGVVEFENASGGNLVVINANRKPAEHALGVDLIYFNRSIEAFVGVQYKIMNEKSDTHLYYNPNQKSHKGELNRMIELQKLLSKVDEKKSLTNYRLSSAPFYFKLCKKIDTVQQNKDMVSGMYFELEHWRMLLTDKSTKTIRNATQLGYHTIKDRYLRTTTFIDLVKSGLIGCQSHGAKKLGTFIEASISQGHSVMYAIESKK